MKHNTKFELRKKYNSAFRLPSLFEYLCTNFNQVTDTFYVLNVQFIYLFYCIVSLF